MNQYEKHCILIKSFHVWNSFAKKLKMTVNLPIYKKYFITLHFTLVTVYGVGYICV